MKKTNLLLLFALISFVGFAQPVQFTYSNKASFSFNGTDTLKFPYTGGLNAPQFNRIDLDGDGVKDLFVFDRAGSKALTYLYKNGVYVYAPQYESQFPPLFKWVIFKDYNCDGKEDIFTEVDYNAQPEKDKYVSSNGMRVLRNVSTQPGKLLWQQDRNQLMDTGLGSLPPSNLSISNADYNAIEDVDNDGDLDLIIMPIGKNVITYYQNLSKERGFNCDSLLFVFRDECWGYMSYMVNTNAFVLNDNSSCYRNYKTAKHNGTTLTVYDADNDGDKDLLYGDIGFQSLIMLKNGKTLNSLGRDSVIAQDTVFPKNSVQAKLEIFPASFILDVDGDNKRDLVVAPNAETAAKNKDQVMFYKNTGTDAVPVFTYQNSNFIVGNTFDLGGGSIPVFCDIDGDLDQDLFVCTQGDYTLTANSNDRIVFFRNTGTVSKATYVLADSNFLNINATAPKIQRMVPTFGDMNADGKPDLLIGDLNGKLHYYENTSVGSTLSFNKVSSNYFSIFGGTSAAPQIFDLNKDGKPDIVMGRKNGTLAYFENTGSAAVANFGATPTIDSIGKFTVAEMVMSGGQPYYFDGYAVPHVCDIDKDGRFEVIVGSDMGRVFLFRNFEASATRVCEEIPNIFLDNPSAAPAALYFGPKTSGTVADLDGDGKPELMIGNARGGIRLYTPDIKGIISSVKEQSIEAGEWKLFPNPAKNSIQLKTDRNCKGMAFRIYDIMGNELQSGQLEAYETSIDINGLTPGFYLLQSSNEQGNSFFARFLVE